MNYIRLNVLWPQGTVIPVRIRRGAKASELFELLKFSVASGHEMYLIYKGFVLNPNETLESQIIEENPTLKVEFVPEGYDLELELNLTRLHSKMQDIYEESLRLDDLRFAMIESHPAGKLTYEEILRMEESSDFSDVEEHEPVIIQKPDKIPTEPLPCFWVTPNTFENEYKKFTDSQNLQGTSTQDSPINDKSWNW